MGARTRPFVVGLTGGIGSGKSAAADEFGRLGATIVDTDVIAHELTRPGGAAIPALRATFGDDCIDASGAMDRRRMRELVFRDPGQRKRLELLLHPLIRDENDRQIAAASKAPYVVMVVPLLAESIEYRKRSDRILVIDCPEEVQVERVKQRSGLSEEEVLRIIRSQIARADRLAVAHDVIENRGPLDSLREAVRALHERYLRLARV
jgi:dephospho-CoA kinase